MPFNEKGEIIRPDNREKTRSDIQRSPPSWVDEDDVAYIYDSFYIITWMGFFISPFLFGDYYWSVFHWSACLLSIVLVMWARYCCEYPWFKGFEEYGFTACVVFVIMNFFWWPLFLMLSVISLLTNYFCSFMKKVVVVGKFCFCLAVLVAIIAGIIAAFS